MANMMIDFDLVRRISDHEGFEHVCVLICGFYKLYLLFLQTCSSMALVTSGKRVREFDG